MHVSCISLSSLFRPVVQFGPSSIRPHIHPCQFVSVRLVLLLSGPFGHFRLSDRLHLCRCCLHLHHHSSSSLSCLPMRPLIVTVRCSLFVTIGCYLSDHSVGCPVFFVHFGRRPNSAVVRGTFRLCRFSRSASVSASPSPSSTALQC